MTDYSLPEVVEDICKIVSIARDMVEYSRANGVAIPGEWDDVAEAAERLLGWAKQGPVSAQLREDLDKALEQLLVAKDADPEREK